MIFMARLLPPGIGRRSRLKIQDRRLLSSLIRSFLRRPSVAAEYFDGSLLGCVFECGGDRFPRD